MIKLGERSGLVSDDITTAQIQSLTINQLTNLTQSQKVIVTIQLTNAVMAFEVLSEIPDFVGSGLQSQVVNESRPRNTLSEVASITVI